jgi:hypothetical protein
MGVSKFRGGRASHEPCWGGKRGSFGEGGGNRECLPHGFCSKCYASRPAAVKQLAVIRFGTKLAKRSGKANYLERFRTKSVWNTEAQRARRARSFVGYIAGRSSGILGGRVKGGVEKSSGSAIFGYSSKSAQVTKNWGRWNAIWEQLGKQRGIRLRVE